MKLGSLRKFVVFVVGVSVAEASLAAGASILVEVGGSTLTLSVQGGPYSPVEAAVFEGQPHAQDAVRLRRWDEQAKVRGLVTPALDHFRPHLQQSLK